LAQAILADLLVRQDIDGCCRAAFLSWRRVALPVDHFSF